jgi:hypothetical protein
VKPDAIAFGESADGRVSPLCKDLEDKVAEDHGGYNDRNG